MAIVEMKKATIVALLQNKPQIMQSLQEFGVLHITDFKASDDLHGLESIDQKDDEAGLQWMNEDLIKVNYMIEFLKRQGERFKSRSYQKRTMNRELIQGYLNDRTQLVSIYDAILKIDKAMSDLKSKETKYQTTISFLMPWITFEERLEDVKDTKNVHIEAGVIAKRHEANFYEAVENEPHDISVLRVGEEGDNVYFLFACLKQGHEALSKLLKQYGFNKISFGDMTGTAKANIDATHDALKNLVQTRTDLTKEAKALTKHTELIETYYDILTVETDKSDVTKSFLKSKETFVIGAWIPVALMAELNKRLYEITPNIEIFFHETDKNEMSPTLLKNHRYARPLEFITEQYSTPDSRGIDPNAMMMPFFVIFFGIMVSDFVYGLILISITAIILIKLKPEGNFQKILGVLCLGGVSTAFWGMMFGGYLGGMIPVSPILFDPLKDPFKMIAMCIAFGIIHLFVGFGMQAYMNIRRGYILDAILDQGLWVLFILSIMSMFLPDLAPFNKYATIGFALSLVLTQGRRKSNILMKLMSGILSLYNITGFLGDALSYLRLFALGLATGVIGTVINSMAFMLDGSIIGYFFMIIVLIIGHTFNIAINTLGAYVHSSRLQYVEFFSKFYEGEGIKYNPFRVRTKFINIEPSGDFTINSKK